MPMSPLVSAYATLLSAIVLEVIGTTLLQKSAQFTRLWPTLGMAVCYLGSFWLLSLTLRTLPVGIAYATWSGLGMVLIALAGWWLYGQRLDGWALLGMALVVAGVLVMNLLSPSSAH